ncbi:class I SAM-dependent methyltransferase [Bradyrhizobium australiense]|uniref:class I SAM-dependent methyltransferase n=1 Tax=Bradyrhizobium australiense TaxID=2721161 RepID=UPI0028A016D3|nr:class I SAM-dependent methyltransferase [Bradyrhizobium australiense]
MVSWLEALNRKDLRIPDVGCGAGWLCSQLTRFGQVTGTDLSDEVLARAARRVPEAHFVAGDFMSLDLRSATYDVAISLEVLAHVSDQPAFLGKIAGLLKRGGYLMLATQNKPALMRNDIPAPKKSCGAGWIVRNLSNCSSLTLPWSRCSRSRRRLIEDSFVSSTPAGSIGLQRP